MEGVIKGSTSMIKKKDLANFFDRLERLIKDIGRMANIMGQVFL